MRRNESIRIVAILVVLIVAAIFFYPTARLWLMSSEEKATMADRDPLGLRDLESSAIKLGLDLRGGMHIVLRVDVSEMTPAEAKNARDRALEIIRNRVDKFGISEPQIIPQGDDYIVVDLPGLQDVERAQELIGKTAQLEFRFLETPEKTRQLVSKIDGILGKDPLAAMESAAEGDTTAVAKDDTSSQKEMEDAVADLFDETADTTEAATDSTDSLLLDDFEEPAFTAFSGYLDQTSPESYIVFADDVPLLKKYLALEKVQAVTPHDNEWMWGTRDESFQGRMMRRLYLAKRKVELTGDCLVSATPGYDQYRNPQVNFRLTKDCGSKFARITGPNIGKPLAIILDGQVESGPRINDRIRDEGVITMGGGASFDDANDMSIVLQAGALPAPVRIVENNVVGPSLGKDSINSGFTASLVGLLVVVLVMAFYYRLSGLVANFALVFNLFVLLSVMSMLKATLTVPGIAGIILLVGISVDAAVLIFERIREELVTGKTVRASIDAGYDRAAVAIIDSNITTLIVAGILYAFGTGPVKGFAVTLSIGILVSLFSALVVTRTIFEFRKSYKTLSI
ncbi:MAG: protein translocase subunit SecD [candidate division Zixibacteria bacterium]|nr:protein translocase subunit SecD [candidate division Zixibacteria bacterium]